jgi:hypothetical protein
VGWGDKFWKMLPDTKRNKVPWPLILGGADADDCEKRERLADHIRYAEQQGVLERVGAFLISLRPSEWCYEGGAKPYLKDSGDHFPP